MILVVLILALSGVPTLNAWQLLDKHIDPLETWGITRVKRGARRPVEKEFHSVEDRECEDMHKTEEAPFTAIILFKSSGRLLCMGSIVDKQHILSAKRCYDKTDVGELLVLVGYYKAYWGEHSQVLHVKKIVRHEYEIALLRLKESIMFTDYVDAARLPPSSTKTIDMYDMVFPPPYKVVGFDVDRFDVPGELIPKDKIYTLKEDTFFAWDECKKNYTKLILETTKLFCSLGNATYCWGGWGAPVLKWMPNLYFVQIGVVITDNCTASTTSPYLIARTDVYGDWIRGNSYHGHQPS